MKLWENTKPCTTEVAVVSEEDCLITTQLLCHVHISIPVILIQRVLNGNNGILCNPACVLLNHLGSTEQPVGVGLPVLVSLAVTFIKQL